MNTYNIGALVFPTLHDEQNSKLPAILDRMVNLIYSIHNDHPDQEIVIYTPNLYVFGEIPKNIHFVSLHFVEDPVLFTSSGLQNFHIWAEDNNPKEARSVEVIQQHLESANIYTVSVFL